MYISDHLAPSESLSHALRCPGFRRGHECPVHFSQDFGRVKRKVRRSPNHTMGCIVLSAISLILRAQVPPMSYDACY